MQPGQTQASEPLQPARSHAARAMGPGNECRDDSRFVARASLPCVRCANAVGVAPGATALVWQASCEAPPSCRARRPVLISPPEKQGQITMADDRRVYPFGRSEEDTFEIPALMRK